MEEQLRAGLGAEAERVDVDVDALWHRVEPAFGARPAARRGLAVAGATAAALLLVVGAVVLARQGDPNAPVPAGPATGQRSTPDDGQEPPAPAEGPIPLNARRIDGNLVAGEVLLVDVRTAVPPVRGLVGPVYTYAYPCQSDGTDRVCVTRVDSRTPNAMHTARVSRRGIDPVVPWSNGRQLCCANLIAYPAGRGGNTVTRVFANDVALPIERFRGEGWPYRIIVAVSPRDIFGMLSGSIEIELSSGRSTMMIS